MTHEELIMQANYAINAVFLDTSVDMGTVKESLEELAGRIERYNQVIQSEQVGCGVMDRSKYKLFRILVHSGPIDCGTFELYEYHESKDAAIEAHKHNVVFVEEAKG